MTIYAKTMLAAVLGEYADEGFKLREDGEDVELCFKDKFIAYFSQVGTTVENIRGNCQRYLDSLNGEGIWRN